MNKTFAYLSLVLFVVASLANLSGHLLGYAALYDLSKVFLMPLLAAYFFLKVPRQNANIVFLVALSLFFCWVGDILLIYTGRGELFFMLGLLSFLLGHVFYILVYRKAVWHKQKTAILHYKPHWITPFLVYSLALYNLLWPQLGEMQLPVLIYTLVLMLMGIFTLNRYDLTSLVSFRLVLLGACLFIISDSMIALNKFGYAFAHAGFWVMCSYILAQYSIVQGLLFHFEEKESDQPKFFKN